MSRLYYIGRNLVEEYLDNEKLIFFNHLACFCRLTSAVISRTLVAGLRGKSAMRTHTAVHRSFCITKTIVFFILNVPRRNVHDV